jgi:hypothetical protein
MSCSITLVPSTNDKIGVCHCNVTREGYITVSGKPMDIADGEEIIYVRARIKALRKGSEYTFSCL